jgi:phosphoribosylformylglycinamidine synthase
VADGGLAIALAECCILNNKKTFGIEANIDFDLPEHLLFFSESQSRFIISTSQANKEEIERLFQEQNVLLSPLGQVGGAVFSLNNKIETKVIDLVDMYYQTIPKIMDQ